MGRRAIYNQDQVGEFDEYYFFFNEDLDWSIRAYRKRLVFHYLPHLPVVHYGGQGRAQNRDRLLSDFYRMNLYFYAKFYGRAMTWVVYIFQTAELMGRLTTLRLAGKHDSREARAYLVALEDQRRFMEQGSRS
jgi:GT2 family glycosyltransferase